MSSRLNDAEYFGLGASMVVLLIVGCVFQAFTLFVLTRPAFKQFDLSPYFLNIIIANSVVILVDFPPIIASAWAQRNMLGEIYCQIVGFLSWVGCISTIATFVLTLLKTHRKLRDDAMEFEIAFAERYAWERHNIIKTLTGTWLYGIAVMFPPMVTWGSFNFESGDTVCAPNWQEESSAGRIYMVLLILLVFVIPLGFSAAYFGKIYNKLLQDRGDDGISLRAREKARKAVVIIWIGVAIFMVSWMPYCVCAMMALFGGSKTFNPEISFIPGVVAKASAVFNPLFCLLASTRFRNVALKLICMCRKIEEDEEDEEEIDDLSQGRQLRPSALMQRSLQEELSRIRRMRRYQQTRAEARRLRINGPYISVDIPAENLETSV